MNNVDDMLLFGDFPSVHVPSGNSPPAAHISVNSPDHISSEHTYNSGDNVFKNEKSSQDQSVDQGPKTVSILSIKYYQQFFDVETDNVIERIIFSMIPKRAPHNYLRSHIGLHPDLYGPVWITITLIFSIAISGNIASYLQYTHANGYHWKYNFNLVSYAATAIFVYSFLIPIALWALFKSSIKPWDDQLESDVESYTPSLLSLICVYGYSLAIYIPVSVLWVIQISWLQWVLVISAAFLSGTVLVTVLSPALKNSKISVILLVGIIAVNFLLAAGFMLVFFHVPPLSSELPAHLLPDKVSASSVNTTLAV